MLGRREPLSRRRQAVLGIHAGQGKAGGRRLADVGARRHRHRSRRAGRQPAAQLQAMDHHRARLPLAAARPDPRRIVGGARLRCHGAAVRQDAGAARRGRGHHHRDPPDRRAHPDLGPGDGASRRPRRRRAVPQGDHREESAPPDGGSGRAATRSISAFIAARSSGSSGSTARGRASLSASSPASTARRNAVSWWRTRPAASP